MISRSLNFVFKNFKGMPFILKILTTCVLAIPIFLLATLNMGGKIEVAGKPITNLEWWSSGAGVIILLVGILMVTASTLLLKKSPFGRPMYIFGFFLLTFSEPLILKLTTNSIPPAVISGCIFNALVVVAIALYFWLHKDVKKYFSTS